MLEFCATHWWMLFLAVPLTAFAYFGGVIALLGRHFVLLILGGLAALVFGVAAFISWWGGIIGLIVLLINHLKA